MRRVQREEVLTWVEAQGVAPTGEVRLVKERPWSAVLEVHTRDAAPVWFKEGRAGCAFEPRLLQALQAYGAEPVLLPLAVDAPRGWMLFPDGSPVLRETSPTLAQWQAMLPAYGQLQRSLEHRALPGCEDLGPRLLPEVLDGLLDTVPTDRTEELRALQPRFAQWCTELDDSGIVPSIDHGDLHDGNVFADGRFFDWGDAALAHPFCSVLVLMRSCADRFGLETGSAELRALRDAYLEPWTDRWSRTELELLALLATRVGKVVRVRSWQRALSGPVDPGEHAEAVPGWLEELLEPDVF